MELDSLKEDIKSQEDLTESEFKKIQALNNDINLLNNKKIQLSAMLNSLQVSADDEYSKLSSILNFALKDRKIIPSWFVIFGYEENLDSYQKEVMNLSKSIFAFEESLEDFQGEIISVDLSLESISQKRDGLEEDLIKNEKILLDYRAEFSLFESKHQEDIVELRKKRDVFEKDVDAETILTYRGSRWEVPLYKPCDGVISSPFDPNRLHPVLGYVRPHNGQDIAAPKGDPVYAAETGRVIFVGERGGSWAGLGKFIIIQHDDGWETRYAHLSKILIDNEKAVKRGDKIGLVGSTGLSTGPHLHFETRKNNIPYDPMPLLNIYEK